MIQKLIYGETFKIHLNILAQNIVWILFRENQGRKEYKKNLCLFLVSRVHDSRGLFLCSLLYFGNIIDSTNGIKLLPYAGNVMGCIGGKVGSAIKEFTVS